jgi:hypothetical protein
VIFGEVLKVEMLFDDAKMEFGFMSLMREVLLDFYRIFRLFFEKYLI